MMKYRATYGGPGNKAAFPAERRVIRTQTRSLNSLYRHLIELD